MDANTAKTLESLELIVDDGNFATCQAPDPVCQAKKENEWAVMEDNGGTLHMWVKDANGDYVFASPVMPEDVSLNLCPIDEEEDRIITVSHPKVLTNNEKESFDKIRAGLEWLGLETEYEEEAVASWENGYPATQFETGFRLSERFVGIAAAIL